MSIDHHTSDTTSRRLSQIRSSVLQMCGINVLASLMASTALAQAITQTVVTPAATTFCSSSNPTFPAQFTWGSAGIAGPTNAVYTPSGAPNVTPQVFQYRNGTLIATYSNLAGVQGNPQGCDYLGGDQDWQNPSYAASKGCGPFGYSHAIRLWAPGDTFYLSPAIFTGVNNQPYFGSLPDDQSPNPPPLTAMSNITIIGQVTNNYRPVIYYNPTQADYASGFNLNQTLGQSVVYMSTTSNMSWSNIDVVAGPGARSFVASGSNPLQAAVYDNGSTNLYFGNSRISGFDITNYTWYAHELTVNPGGPLISVGADGFIGSSNNTGTLKFYEVQIDHDGGFGNNYDHNVYIDPSATDSNYSVTFQLSWSHDAWQGHLFKSRAQATNIVSSYLQGGLPQSGLNPAVAEAYLLDVPNGGKLTVFGSLFAKNMSGPNSNGASIEYNGDGPPSLPNANPSVDVEHNTFAAFAATFDGTNAIYPFLESNPPVNTNVEGNLFAGYCYRGNTTLDNRGYLAVIAAPSELSKNWLGPNYTYAGTNPGSGLPKYNNVTNSTANYTATNNVGAQ